MPNETQNSTYKCPVCQTETAKPIPNMIGSESYNEYSCPRCGDYSIVDLLEESLINNDIQKIAVLSHWVRTSYEAISSNKLKRRKKIILTEDLIDDILKNPPPSPAEQADNVVRWLGSKPPGESITVQPQNQLSIIGSATSEELKLVLDYLISAGLVLGNIHRTSSGLTGFITLSFEGWQYYEKLKRGATDSCKAFMAMQYGDEQLDKIVEEVFKLAVKQTGFDLFKLMDKPKAGLIDDRLRVEIQMSRFLIADLTHENAGSYWEAGYAEGLGKPVIYTCEKKKFEEQKTHFDTNHHLTIPWDEKNPKEAAEKLKATIRATLPEQAKLTDD
jgi:hypothetical protein